MQCRRRIRTVVTLIFAAGVGVASFLPMTRAAAQTLEKPVFVRADSGWIGLFGHGSEYARFLVPGRGAQLQDAGRILIRPGLGLSVTFVANAELSGVDVLRAHAQWEADYWRAQGAKVEAVTRDDITGIRSGVRVTVLTLRNRAGATMAMYLVAQRTADGVFAYAFSPAKAAGDKMIRQFVRSLTIVSRPLTQAEVARLSSSLKK
jgi:hypothetical protein